MSPRRSTRARRRSSENADVVDAELSKGKFSFIYRESRQIDIKVKHCVPLFKSRTICESAIRSLRSAFDVDEFGNIGYSYAGGIKVVVKLPESELQVVHRYLMETGQGDLDATDLTFRKGIEWYGIVDGIHTHRSFSDLEQSRPDPFHDFKRTVTVIKWQTIRILKAFSRARNMLQTVNSVKMTLFDTISGFYEIALSKANLAGQSFESFIGTHGVITAIADEFSGGTRYSRQTTRTLAGAALRIKREALEVLGQIMSEENDDIARRVMKKTLSCTVPLEEVFDARVYKNMISTNTIRSATAFLDADGSDQSNALLRLKFSYEENGFKTFQAARLNKEITRCRRARRQDYIMKNVMGRDNWPVELAGVRKKLLQTSVFDSELDQSDEHTNSVIGSLITEYRERRPLEAGLRWHMYLRYLQSMPQAPIVQGNHTSGSCSRGNGSSNNAPATYDDGAENNDDSGVDRFEAETNSGNICPLRRLGVDCLNLTLERYSLNRRSEDEKFHLVLGDPTQLQLNGTRKVMVDDRQADSYVGILKLMVQEHGWVFFYTSAVDFAMWNKAFKSNSFETLPYPWVMVRETDTIQMNTSPIPQNITELLIGARKIGNGRPEHQPNITSSYKRSVSSRKRKFAIMDECLEPRLKIKKRNTREPIRSNQRSAEPIAEFLETFCPPHGFVLDAFSGTMETAKACYLTSRNCVALEADKACFDVALETLKANASAYLSQTSQLSTDAFIELGQHSNQITAKSIVAEVGNAAEAPEGAENKQMDCNIDRLDEEYANISEEQDQVLDSPVTNHCIESLESLKSLEA